MNDEAKDGDMDDERDYVQECREWLARRKAWLDQKEKRFERQYDTNLPFINQIRLDDLEVWKFEIEIHEWELEEYIKSLEEEDGDL